MDTPRSPLIVLRRCDVVAAEPCVEGLALFDEFVALQGHGDELRLTWTHLLWALAYSEDSGAYVRWAHPYERARELGACARLDDRSAA